MKPWMSAVERDFIASKLRFSDPVLEWGSGGSTLFFSKLCNCYYSIEHNMEWYKKVHEEIKKQGLHNVYQFFAAPEFEHTGLTPAAPGQFERYSSLPLHFGMKFSRVLVDGRARLECAIKARSVLHPGGLLFLHDYIPERMHRYGRITDYYSLIEQVETLGVFMKNT